MGFHSRIAQWDCTAGLHNGIAQRDLRVNRTNTKELLTVPIAFIDHFDLVKVLLDLIN